MRTLKQLLRDFWIPFIIAALWALYKYIWPAPSDWLSVLITNFAASFFLASWAYGHIIRIKRQHSTEDSLEEIEKQLGQLGTTTKSISGTLPELQELSKNFAALQPVIQHLSNLTLTANTQVAAANNAVAETRSRADTSSLGWYSDSPLPLRAKPNPAIHEWSNFVPPPPVETTRN